MKFFSKETCQKLQEFGCKTDEEYSFYPDEELPHRKRWHSDEVDAFTIADFLSDEPYALENCKKVFNLEDPFKVRSFKMILCVSEDQEAFILEALNGK